MLQRRVWAGRARSQRIGHLGAEYESNPRVGQRHLKDTAVHGMAYRRALHSTAYFLMHTEYIAIEELSFADFERLLCATASLSAAAVHRDSLGSSANESRA